MKGQQGYTSYYNAIEGMRKDYAILSNSLQGLSDKYQAESAAQDRKLEKEYGDKSRKHEEEFQQLLESNRQKTVAMQQEQREKEKILEGMQRQIEQTGPGNGGMASCQDLYLHWGFSPRLRVDSLILSFNYAKDYRKGGFTLLSSQAIDKARSILEQSVLSGLFGNTSLVPRKWSDDSMGKFLEMQHRAFVAEEKVQKLEKEVKGPRAVQCDHAQVHLTSRLALHFVHALIVSTRNTASWNSRHRISGRSTNYNPAQDWKGSLSSVGRQYLPSDMNPGSFCCSDNLDGILPTGRAEISPPKK